MSQQAILPNVAASVGEWPLLLTPNGGFGST
jgi:hypothetical protein